MIELCDPNGVLLSLSRRLHLNDVLKDSQGSENCGFGEHKKEGGVSATKCSQPTSNPHVSIQSEP